MRRLACLLLLLLLTVCLCQNMTPRERSQMLPPFLANAAKSEKALFKHKAKCLQAC